MNDRQRNIQTLAGLGGGVFLTLVILAASTAGAHHILGTPHYAYDDQYPQTPVLSYAVEVGDLKLKVTGYPGRPEPGERWALHIYIVDGEGEIFDETVELTVRRERTMGKNPIVYGPIEVGLEEGMYKFFPTFDREGNYRVAIDVAPAGEHYEIVLPIEVGTPRSPLATFGKVAAGAVFFLVLARAFFIKRSRKKRKANRGAATTLPEQERTIEGV